MTDVVLTGLAKQLVQAELLNEKSAQQAYQQARQVLVKPRLRWSFWADSKPPLYESIRIC